MISCFVGGATQVKWNKVTNNLFATAHEGDVRVWDPRVSLDDVVYLFIRFQMYIIKQFCGFLLKSDCLISVYFGHVVVWMLYFLCLQ